MRRLLALLLLTAAAVSAAPSGGPYGPIQQSYTVPTGAGVVHYVAPDGDAAQPGRSPGQPTTLEAAISRVTTGDVVVLRGGVYRTGDLRLNQGITLQPYADEQPILKGTRVVTAEQAVKQRNGLWRVKWDTLFPLKPQPWWRRESNGHVTPQWRFNNDMVFVDGQPLKTVGWEGEVDAGSFSVDYEAGNIYLAVDPAAHLVEITAFDNAITRTIGEVHGRKSDGKGPVIRGLTFTQYAYRAIEIEGYDPEKISAEHEHGKDVVGTTLEHVTITHCSRVAGYFRGDNMVFRHCLISDTSTEGIFILASNDALLEKNIFRRNNIEDISGYFPAAVKIFNQTRRVIVRDNLLYDNANSEGIWYDVGNIDGVFVDNWIIDSRNGFFFEISKGVICAGNVFVNNRSGVFILNSAGARIYQNTFINSDLQVQRTSRSAVGDHFDWHPASGPDVDERVGHEIANNLFLDDGSFGNALLRILQAPDLAGKLTDAQVSVLDHNVYVRTAPVADAPLIQWSPAATETANVDYATLDAFRAAVAGLESASLALDHYRGPSVRSHILERYDLMDGFTGRTAGGPLPADVARLLGLPTAAGGAVGAFPVK